ncbi:TIGR03667 family PPOX class F420-dependent oxidoreductase [Kribbella deserti]|uniref:TIGR03667 family PPOX class F420-dependent oxidoreductase n=1 Tax=Kribbella deserti TaxID=1926257 RepID=A0ABV6QLW4_9ACTN
MFTIDTDTEFGGRVRTRLTDELVVWLTTVGKSGTPQPNPVWFYFNGEEILIFSQAGKPKVHNVRHSELVSVHFNATEYGGDVVVFTGTAKIDESGPTEEERTAYNKKYAEGLASLNMTAAKFHEEYPVLIRITPIKVRGF